MSIYTYHSHNEVKNIRYKWYSNTYLKKKEIYKYIFEFDNNKETLPIYNKIGKLSRKLKLIFTLILNLCYNIQKQHSNLFIF